MVNFRKLIGGVAAAALIGAMAMTVAPQEAQAKKVRWAVPISFASTLTALGDTLPWVAERINEVSGGDITFEVFEPNKLVPALGIYDAVSEGKIDAGYSWMGYEQGKLPASALFGATPFGLETDQFAAWMYFHGGDDLLKELFAPHNVRPILCGSISPEAAGWFKFPVESVDQFKGLKFRAAGLGGKIMQEMGASVTVLPGGELYQALEKGVLDGTEFSLPTVDKQLGFSQVAKFYHLPGWHQPSTNQFLYVNTNSWDKLDDTQKAQIETTCMAGTMYAISRAEALQGAVLKEFQDDGVTAVQLPKDVLSALQEATNVVLDRESEKDPMFKKIIDSMRAFQEENRDWKNLGYLPRDFGTE
ncbi:MAG TPA: C4-dicarboxylate ABC transporter [Rhodospirillaceae bacterium]|nr:C4-dicarboxylate ABC transporter [Alphaproteobacteria bacterium]OUT39545.1 MAG: C4-dicarboxylate ABC transporter [Micavibrio sp. TMED2]HCI46616.1 C4-dicarboxylate ABC transporter [Rhodospirillaceae bacterium]MAS48934.1 C4-dicarboxylate ABC transporter [Alphaproteobacteria bacterium]MAX97464.1 C4-dicarboxylate ABC transporter [Alphaproteobacteria bacterium]|tara:strand:- start:10336 stop:11415 length:1080 start_codon:yes stop_codon:yes gene_type:complete